MVVLLFDICHFALEVFGQHNLAVRLILLVLIVLQKYCLTETFMILYFFFI